MRPSPCYPSKPVIVIFFFFRVILKILFLTLIQYSFFFFFLVILKILFFTLIQYSFFFFFFFFTLFLFVEFFFIIARPQIFERFDAILDKPYIISTITALHSDV